MEEIKLNVQTRDEIGSQKIKSLRKESFIPAIVYGGEDDAVAIKVDRREYERIMRAHKGQSVVFHINVSKDGKKVKDYPAIVKEEQHEPVLDQLLHIDFKRISLTEEIEVKSPIAIKGEPVGVKQDGGSLDQPLWELDVICLPTNIPEKIEVEVSEMTIGDAVHVKDLVLPAGVRTDHDPEAIVVSVVPPMKEEPVEAVAEEETLTEPEVIKEKKPKEEAAEAESEEKSE